jgi:hypothetical protein
MKGTLMLTEEQRNDAVDRATVAASDQINAVTPDMHERRRMWWAFIGGVFLSVFTEADAVGQDTIATRLNAALKAAGAGWHLVRT